MTHDPQSESCRHFSLAHSEVCDVAVCPGCGVIHLSLQYLSLRFEPEAFHQLARTLAAAQAHLNHLEEAHSRAAQAQPESADRLGSNLH